MATASENRFKRCTPRTGSRVVPAVTSCLYECHVTHARFAPKAHRFAYRIFLFAIDLDELSHLHRTLRLFSTGRPNLYRFNENDYLPPSDSAPAPPTHSNPAHHQNLKARVIARLAESGIDLTGGRVLLVTLPRVLGYLFNPVSFYFCYDRAGAPVAAIAEVTNTFREMKSYILGPDTWTTAPARAAFHLRVPKYFYVSPFSDVDVAFDFRLHPPGERLDVRVDDFVGDARTLASALIGTQRPLSDRGLAWLTLKYPLITLRIIGLIHWHAILLWMKKVPWFAKAARSSDQRGFHRPAAGGAAYRHAQISVSADPLQSLPKV